MLQYMLLEVDFMLDDPEIVLTQTLCQFRDVPDGTQLDTTPVGGLVELCAQQFYVAILQCKKEQW